jgi:nitroimidazol reductase NimA-like FMN-containing flavoprotein (pyridoxamine 5'-phosphate oxidase superfamily)
VTTTRPIDARTGLEVLDRVECLLRLGNEHVGRLGVCVDGQPLVLPINYVLDGDDIIFRSDRGTKVHSALGHRVAFEIDGHDAFSHAGWSVLVIGIAGRITDPSELARVATLHVSPYGPGDKPVWVRIRSDAITGRRIPRP